MEKKTALFYSCLLAIAGFIFFRFLVYDGFPVFRDHPAHFAYLSHVAETAQNSHVWHSWDMKLGMPINEHQYILGYGLGLALNTLGLSVEVCYKVLIFAVAMLLPISLFFLFQIYFRPIYAFLGASFILFYEDFIYLLASGFWHLYLAVTMTLLFLRILFKDWQPSTVMWGSILMALIFWTHLYIGIFSFLLLWIAGHCRAKDYSHKKAFYYVITISILTSILLIPYFYRIYTASFWLQELAYKISLNFQQGWKYWILQFLGTPIQIGRIEFAKLLRFILLILAMMFGLMHIFNRKKTDSFQQFWIYTILLSWGFGTGVIPMLGTKLHLPFLGSTILHGFRFMIFAEFGLLVFAILALQKLCIMKNAKWDIEITFITLLVLTGSLLAHKIPQTWVMTSNDSELTSYHELTQYLRGCLVSKSERIYVQTTAGNLAGTMGNSHILATLPLQTGMRQFGAWMGGSLFPIERYTLSESQRLFGQRISNIDSNFAKSFSEAWNIRLLILCHDKSCEWADQMDWLKKVQDISPFKIYETNFLHQELATIEKGTTLNLIENTNYIAFQAELSEEGPIVIREVFHPGWSAFVDEQPVIIEKDDFERIIIPSVKPGLHQIHLVYHSKVRGIFGLGFLIIYVFCAWGCYRRLKYKGL